MLFGEGVCICVCVGVIYIYIYVCVCDIYIYIMTLWECAIHPDLEIRDFYGVPLFSKGNHHFFRKATLTALLHCPYSLTLFSSWYYFIFFTHIIFPSSLFFPFFFLPNAFFHSLAQVNPIIKGISVYYSFLHPQILFYYLIVWSVKITFERVKKWIVSIKYFGNLKIIVLIFQEKKSSLPLNVDILCYDHCVMFLSSISMQSMKGINNSLKRLKMRFQNKKSFKIEFFLHYQKKKKKKTCYMPNIMRNWYNIQFWCSEIGKGQQNVITSERSVIYP